MLHAVSHCGRTFDYRSNGVERGEVQRIKEGEECVDPVEDGLLLPFDGGLSLLSSIKIGILLSLGYPYWSHLKFDSSGRWLLLFLFRSTFWPPLARKHHFITSPVFPSKLA